MARQKRTLVVVEHPLAIPRNRVRHLLLLSRPTGDLLLHLAHLIAQLRVVLADDVRLKRRWEGRGRGARARV